MLFPGFAGVATAVGLFASIWLIIYLKSKGEPIVFDPEGPGTAKFSSIDFPGAPIMAPLGHCVDLFGDGSLWAISAPGHTDDDIAYLINGATPVLLTGDASHFAWAFQHGVAPRGWDKARTARGYVSLEQLRAFARIFPTVKLIYGHEAPGF